ncbi:FAR1 DNA-binding domain [Sesbania bispinosa]|nr:FAR1 DNA-binding domain [Sesbania bispinosa]
MEDLIGGRSDLNDENNASEGGEGISSSNGNNVDNENGGVDGEGEHMDEHSDAEVDVDEYRIDNKSDIKRVQFLSLTIEKFKLYHFFSRLVAFEFYNKYALKKGFAGRRWNFLKNKRGEVTQQEFVCYKEGFRDKKHLERTGRKREQRAMTRCGCPAFCCVHLDRESGRWRVKAFNDVHSHELLGEKLAAKHCGGYNRIGYRKRDMYNEIVRERRIRGGRSGKRWLVNLVWRGMNGFENCMKRGKCGQQRIFGATSLRVSGKPQDVEGLNSQIGRWTKYAKQCAEGTNGEGFYNDR